VDEFSRRLSAGIDDVADWMRVNRLQLNADKTQLLWCSAQRRRHQLPLPSVRIGNYLIAPSTTVHDLGIYIVSDLSKQSQIHKMVARCLSILRQLQTVCRSVPALVYQKLVNALVLPRLDYGNATLAGLPAYHNSRLQSVMNAAAWLIAGLRHSEHITDTLASFHWLRAPECVQFKLVVLAFRSLNGLAPPYLDDLRLI
jgi:hypothetical protein